jgi:TRAP-type C4-dicarboxylate transport system substrate-binding protein
MKIRGLVITVLTMCLALVLVALPFLVACTGTTPTPAPSPSPSPTPSPTPAPTPSPETFELKFATPWPTPPFKWGVLFEAWAEDVNELSGGKCTITVHHAGTLAAGPDIAPSLLGGLADIGLIVPAYYSPGEFPVSSGLFSLPLPIAGGFQQATSEMFERVLEAGYLSEYDDFKLVWLEGSPAQPLILVDKKVTSLEELKGLKIRTAGAGMSSMVEALGATAVNVPSPELYMALERGIVDGALMSTTGIVKETMYDTTKYMLWDDSFMTYGVFSIALPRELWNSLPGDVQLAMLEAGKKMHWENWDQAYYETVDTFKAYKEGGRECLELSPEESARWAALIEPVAANWAADLDAQGFPASEALELALFIAAQYGPPRYYK